MDVRKSLRLAIKNPVYVKNRLIKKWAAPKSAHIIRSKACDYEYLKRLVEKTAHMATGNTAEAIESYRLGVADLTTTPVLIEYDYFQGCNISPPCKKCFVSFDKAGVEYDYIGNQFRGLEGFLKYAEIICFGGRGEITCDDNFENIVDASCSGGLLRLLFPTNGTLLYRHIGAITGRVKAIAVSIDASDPELYAHLQGPPEQFHHVLEGLRALNQEKKRKGTPYPLIYLYFTLCKKNSDRLNAYYKLFSKENFGVEYISINRLVYPDDAETKRGDGSIFDFDEQILDDDVYFEIIDEMKRYTENKKTRIIDQLGTLFLCPLDKERQFVEQESCRCPMPWLGMVLHSDGTVRTCYYSAKSIGNWRTTPLSKIWNSHAMQMLREEAVEFGIARHCFTESCPIAFRIKYLLKKNGDYALFHKIKENWTENILEARPYIKLAFENLNVWR